MPAFIIRRSTLRGGHTLRGVVVQDALTASTRDLALLAAIRDFTLTADDRDFTLTSEAP